MKSTSSRCKLICIQSFPNQPNIYCVILVSRVTNGINVPIYKSLGTNHYVLIIIRRIL